MSPLPKGQGFSLFAEPISWCFGMRDTLRDATYWHVTRIYHLLNGGKLGDGKRKILQEALPAGSGFGNFKVHLEGSQGGYLNLSVADWLMRDAGPRRYVYFFMDKPGALRLFMNVDNAALTKQQDPTKWTAVKVRGADLLANGEKRIFFRRVDRTLVLRGDYRGPAEVEPLPTGGIPVK